MQAAAVTDFSQYARLRAQARNEDPAALRATAKQFEALLLQQMLKSMRAASLGDDVLGGEQTQFYQEMFDQQIAQHLAAGRGIGLAEMMVRQMQGRESGIGSRESSAAVMPPVSTVSGQRPQAAAPAAMPAKMEDSSPAAFVRSILPHAEKAAAELGVPARVLVAQAALETGWGRHAMRRDDGSPAFNFFGIKADKRWQGEKVQTMTSEYENGAMRAERADFRAYDSPAAAFDDYVRFLRSNPRYADALRHGGDAQAFASGLQRAGYATDPAYAQKILRIAEGQTMKTALHAARPARLIEV